MPLTNQQYNAIIRQYDLIRIKNKHIHDDRLEDVRTKAPEYDELDKKISELSVEVSKQILTPGITEEKKKEIKKELDENLRDIENAKKEILTVYIMIRTIWILYTLVQNAKIQDMWTTLLNTV